MQKTNQAEVDWASRYAVVKTARHLKITDADWKSTIELLNEIEAVNSATYQTLTDYLVAYQDWFDFCTNPQNIENRGASLEKIMRRDKSRKAIQDKLQ